VKVFADNQTPIVNESYHLQARIGVCYNQSTETVIYNWTSPVIQPDADTVMLLHFDNDASLGENATHIYDFSGNGNNASCTSGSCPTYVSGKIGAAMLYAPGEYVTVQDSQTLDGMDEITIEAWIKADDISDFQILDKNQSYEIYTDPAGHAVFKLFSPDATVQSTSNITIGQWHMIQATYNGSEMKLYFDGVLENTVNRSGSVADTATPMAIGIDAADLASDGFEGLIDQIAVHNRSLPSATLRDHYRLKNGTWYWYAEADDNSTNTSQTGEYFININPSMQLLNISPASGNTYYINETALFRYNASSVLGIDKIRCDITLPNQTIIQTYLNSTGGDTYEANFTNLLLRGSYYYTCYANDSVNDERASYTDYFRRIAPAGKIVDIITGNMTKNTYFDYNTTILQNYTGTCRLNISINSARVPTILIYNHSDTSMHSVIRLSDYTNEDNQSFADSGWAIDLSQINMTSANVTAYTDGNHLLKCTNVTWENLTCADAFDYEYVKEVQNGTYYTLLLNSTDPIFASTAIGNDSINDSTMAENAATTNYGAIALMRVGRAFFAGSDFRPIIRFNLSNVPEGALITNASLGLFFYNIPTGFDSTASRSYSIHKVNQTPERPWQELQVTWNNYNSTNAWTNAGGDFLASPTDTISFDSTALDSFVSWDVTADVQDFSDNRDLNFGWVIQDTVSTALTRRDFRSKEFGNVSQRPRLIINYNRKPNISQVLLNSTFGTNFTSESLTRYVINATDPDNNSIKNITNWYINGTSYAILNMLFEANSGKEASEAKDYSRPQTNGTLNGPAWNRTAGYDGWGVYDFDGTDDFINVSNMQDLDSDFTMSMRVYSNSTAPDDEVFFSTDIQGARGLELKLDNDPGTLRIGLDNSGGLSAKLLSNTVVTTNQWYYFAVTRRGTNYSIYLDGAFENSQNGTITNNTGAYVGMRSDQANHWDGLIDEVLILDRALSPEQIQALYNNRTDRIVSQETQANEVWQACVTPNDNYEDGAEVCSNNLTIAADTTPPNVTDVAAENALYGINESALIFATVKDDVQVDTVLANITQPNGSSGIFQMSYFAQLSRYQVYYNQTGQLGEYNVTIIANDTSNNINDTETTSFIVVKPNITAIKYDSADPVQVGQSFTYHINITTDQITGKVPLDFSRIRAITNTTEFKDSPQMLSTAAGTLLIVYNKNINSSLFPGNHDIYVLRSTDLGKTWTKIQVTDESQHDIFPNIFEDSAGNLIIVYTHTPGNASIWAGGDVWLVNSTDDGQTWGEPYAIITNSTFTMREPVMEQDSSGMYYIVYEAGDGEAYIHNSTQYWTGWPAQRIQLTNNSYGDVDVEIHVINDTFYFAWAPFDPADSNVSDQDIWFANTTNPLVFNALDDNRIRLTNNQFREYETSITADEDGFLYVAWSGTTNISDNSWGYAEQYNRTSNELFVARSFDLGKTWNIRAATDNNISDGYPGVAQTGTESLFYLSSLVGDNDTQTMQIGFAQRDFSPQDAINVTVTDRYPQELIIQSITDGGVDVGNNIINWSFEVIYAGQTNQISFTSIVNQTTLNNTLLNNTANITWYDPQGRVVDTVTVNETTLVLDNDPPSVTELDPNGNLTNQSLPVLISANVTDDGVIDTVFANITLPGGSIQILYMYLNTTTGRYDVLFNNTGTLGRYNYTIFANDTTGNINYTESAYFIAINSPPTTPTNLTCNGGTCNATFNNTIDFNCSGSIDPDNDTITYHVESYYAPDIGARTIVDAEFESDNESFVYQDDIYGTSAPVQAVGQRVLDGNCTSGYCVNVELNLNSPTTGPTFSGGWNRTFNVTDNPVHVEVSFDYKMRLDDLTEQTFDFIEIHYRNITDNSTIIGPQLDGVAGTDGNDEVLSGTISYTAPISSGQYYFDVGCKLTADATNENGECWIDNIEIVAINTTDTIMEWREIGAHLENETFLWNPASLISNTQSNIDFRCRAIDNVSLTFSGYYTVGGNATIIPEVNPPSVILNYPPDNFSTTIPAINFNWTAIDGEDINLTCNLTINGTVNASNIISLNGTPTNYSIIDFSVGDYYWNVTCWDSGNTNTSETRKFTILPPKLISFTLTLPGQAPVQCNGSLPYPSTASMEFNSSNGTEVNVDPCVVGNGACQNSTEPFFMFSNTGNVNLTWAVNLNQSFPSSLRLKANTVYNGTNATNVTTSALNLSVNVAANANVSGFFFGDFVGALANDTSHRELRHKGREYNST
ncbi:DNRLRE domain-containing protein, partial [Candidatus Woesearchaeota archaeon]|nr:DNRLRE domain-containing protein [Candidatus Woesearchaeota archaeon]